jgi:hypothetical protein
MPLSSNGNRGFLIARRIGFGVKNEKRDGSVDGAVRSSRLYN